MDYQRREEEWSLWEVRRWLTVWHGWLRMIRWAQMELYIEISLYFRPSLVLQCLPNSKSVLSSPSTDSSSGSLVVMIHIPVPGFTTPDWLGTRTRDGEGDWVPSYVQIHSLHTSTDRFDDVICWPCFREWWPMILQHHRSSVRAVVSWSLCPPWSIEPWVSLHQVYISRAIRWSIAWKTSRHWALENRWQRKSTFSSNDGLLTLHRLSESMLTKWWIQ